MDEIRSQKGPGTATSFVGRRGDLLGSTFTTKSIARFESPDPTLASAIGSSGYGDYMRLQQVWF